MECLPVSYSRDAGRRFLASRAEAIRVAALPLCRQDARFVLRDSRTANLPVGQAGHESRCLIDTRCHSETAVTPRKQTIRVHPNRHKNLRLALRTNGAEGDDGVESAEGEGIGDGGGDALFAGFAGSILRFPASFLKER